MFAQPSLQRGDLARFQSVEGPAGHPDEHRDLFDRRAGIRRRLLEHFADAPASFQLPAPFVFEPGAITGEALEFLKLGIGEA